MKVLFVKKIYLVIRGSVRGRFFSLKKFLLFKRIS